MSQPAREFIVKIVEMSLWSSDFLLGHILLVILTPPVLIPFIDKLHSTMLCKWYCRALYFFVSLNSWQSGFAHPNRFEHLFTRLSRRDKDDGLWVPWFTSHSINSSLRQIIKYTLLYILVVSGLASLIVLRKFISHYPLSVFNMVSAAIFRNEITFHCTLCQNI